MPIQVQVPNAGTVEFPDGTTPDEITKAVNKHYGKEFYKSTTLSNDGEGNATQLSAGDLLGKGYDAASKFAGGVASTVGNIPAQAYNTGAAMTKAYPPVELPFKPGKPIGGKLTDAVTEDFGNVLGDFVGNDAARGIQNAANKTVKGFTTPEGLATLPLFELKAGRAAMLGLMAAQTPEKIQDTVKTLKDPDATTAQKWEAGGDAFIHLAMMAGIALHKTPKEIKDTLTPEDAAKAVETPANEAPIPPAEEAQPQAAVTPSNASVAPAATPVEVPAKTSTIADEAKTLSTTPIDQFTAGIKKAKGGLTGDAYRIGQSVKTPEDLQALQDGQAAAKVESDSAKAKGDLNTAIGAAMRGQYFREAYEAATGTGSAGKALRENYPDYEPPMPPKAESSTPIVDQTVNKPVEVTPAAEQPQKFKIGNSPQTHSLVEKLPQSEVEKANGEQPIKVKNDKTGQVQTVMESDLTPVKDRTSEVKAPKRNLDAELKAAKLDPSVFQNDAQKREALKRQKAKFPEGPGAATATSESEFNQSGDAVTQEGYGGEFKYGIAERVRDERAKAGQVEPVSPGQGVSAPDSVQRGRELISKGENPEQRLQDFEKTKKFNSDDVAIFRARGEQLAKMARDAEQSTGRLSPEYKVAYDALSKWDARTKAVQTEWAAAGQAQQGETDIDTGTFTGLQREYTKSTGKDFTNKQAEHAGRLAREVSGADKGAEEANKKAVDAVDKDAAKVPDNSPTKPVWKKTKDYINQGNTNFDDIVSRVATDLGMPDKEVRKTLSKNQSTRRLTNDAYSKQATARRIKQQARIWVQTQSMSKGKAIAKAIPSAFFAIKTFGHGTVALGTHAPALAFQPPNWGVFLRGFSDMYRMVGSGPFYEQKMADLQRRPNFVTAKRAGLVNDPFEYEDYSSPEFVNSLSRLFPKTAKAVDWLTHTGNRGYSVLKTVRQDLFDKSWDNLPDTAKTPEMAKAIADASNHTTGVVKARAPKVANLVLFAPRLEASRAAWLAVDPAKAAGTFLDWSNSTPEAKAFAVHQLKEKAWVMGTLLTMLTANQALLKATGSKQSINMTDPTRSDWMKFKVAGMDFAFGKAMLSMARFPANIFQNVKNEGKLNKLIYEDENVATTMFRYGRTQLSPIAGTATDLGIGRDYEQRPLPRAAFGALPGKTNISKRLKSEGVTKPYSWTEYITSSQAPIFASESVKEVWRNGFGMSDRQQAAAFKAFVMAGVMGGTGGRVSDDYYAKK